jgi:hypothetical protein
MYGGKGYVQQFVPGTRRLIYTDEDIEPYAIRPGFGFESQKGRSAPIWKLHRCVGPRREGFSYSVLV